MKKSALLVTAAICGLAQTVSAVNIWVDDFEGETIGTTAGTNVNIGSTLFSGRNTPTLEIVAAPAGFTTASGNVLKITEPGTNNSAALSTNGDGNGTATTQHFLLPATISGTGNFTFSAKIYWEVFSLARPIGELQARFEDATDAQGNGNTLSSGALAGGTAAGVYEITYTGTVSDFFNDPAFDPTQARPFLFLDQRNTSDSVFYMDDISFTADPVPEPSVALLGGLGVLGLLRRRR